MLRYSHGETVANRELDKIFGEGTIKDKRKRNKRAKKSSGKIWIYAERGCRFYRCSLFCSKQIAEIANARNKT